MSQAPENPTQKIAHLARLELSPEEIQTFGPQLSEVISYIEQLQKVDVSGVEPMMTPLELVTPLREDRVQPSPRDEDGEPKVLASAPETLHGGFKVPPVL